jgi:hypothetical protein
MRAATAPSPDVAKPEALAPMTGREFMRRNTGHASGARTAANDVWI